MTTLTAFVTALGALDIDKVNRQFDAPPADLNDADLPASWVQLPQSDEAPLTLQTNGGWPALRAQLVIAYGATAQSTQSDNFASTLELLDNTATVLKAEVKTICKGGLTWSIRPGIVEVAGHDYWAVIADVRGNG